MGSELQSAVGGDVEGNAVLLLKSAGSETALFGSMVGDVYAAV